MGNHAYISFKKNISDEQFETMVQEIIKQMWPSGNIIFLKEHWFVSFANEEIRTKFERFEVAFYRDSKRKFYSGYPAGDLGPYFMHKLHNAIALKYNGILSDDGCPGTFVCKPLHEYETFKNWLIKTKEHLADECTSSQIMSFVNFAYNLAPGEIRDWL